MNKKVDYRKIAERVVRFYEANAGVGHSKAVALGAARTEANILVESEEEAEQRVRGVKGRKLISFAEVLDGQLDGELVVGWPLLLDNRAVVALLKALLAEKVQTDVPQAKKVKKVAE